MADDEDKTTARSAIEDALRKGSKAGESVEVKARWVLEALTRAGFVVLRGQDVGLGRRGKEVW